MNVIRLWGPVLMVMGLIFSVSAMPDPGPPPAGISDKAAHFAVYAALGATLVRALAGGRPSGVTVRRIAAAAVVAALYGVTDELHQHFVPERTPDWLDLAADACGGTAGAILFAAAVRAPGSIRSRRGAPGRGV